MSFESLLFVKISLGNKKIVGSEKNEGDDVTHKVDKKENILYSQKVK